MVNEDFGKRMTREKKTVVVTDCELTKRNIHKKLTNHEPSELHRPIQIESLNLAFAINLVQRQFYKHHF